ncbi:MAG: hypothetical protein ACE5KE_16115 [Methanosarcinales archaeon]
MVKKKSYEEEVKLLEELAKKAVEDEKEWMVVRGGTKVILINEDELTIKPIKA